MIRKKDALDYHSQGRKGKIEVVPTKPLLTQRDLALAYSPGVAEPCLEIARDPELVWEYTSRANLVAVISNGTAVLGLGNIGPEAGKPVMEGKGCLFKKFADIDVFDIEMRTPTDNPEELVNAIAALEPTFGGINLEDIKAPECFYVEEELKRRMNIPVFHDDQHGTAIISGAALLNAVEVQKKKLADLKVVVSGAGASAIACANFYVSLGVRLENILMCDTKGVIHTGRTDGMNKFKIKFARETSARTLADAMKGADVFLGCSSAGVVSKEMIASMGDRPIVFALANPDPEIGYYDAVSVRKDLIMATGRSDFPNQVNNVLGFPFIFRGALDVRAREINEAMKVAASHALAQLARQEVPDSVSAAYGDVSFKFGPEYIIPKPFDTRTLWWVAPAVAKAAIDSGVARIKLDIDAYRAELRRKIEKTPPALRALNLRAKKDPKRIVFPEGDQIRVLRAAQHIVDEGIAKPILLGNAAMIAQAARDLDLGDLLNQVEIITPAESKLFPSYVDALFELRQRKGINRDFAAKLMRRTNPFAMMMVRRGDADGVVGGLTTTYSETIRPALQIVGTAPGVNHICGMYMMVLHDESLKFFSDPTININPDAETLAEVAIETADAVRTFDIVPRVAMISFSSFGSSDHPEPEKVARAVELVRERRPDLEIEGEMMADVAVNYEQQKAEFPFTRLTDAANVLVFPDLSAANVAYKLMMSLGNATAVGPMIVGMNQPVAVLPRDASVDAIVNMTAYTVVRAQQAHTKQK